ncbi:MAG: FHA domain-containing protein [Phycisphaerales bacterium]|nr:FHA domain-containing protein [Phycisphaerales bacterium]
MPTLYVLQGPDKGRTLKTSDPVVPIGRGSEQIPLTDQTVSRRHAEMREMDGAWTLDDLGSANGTWVNGVRVTKSVRLKHGDQIRVGSTLLVYAGDETIEQVSGTGIPTDLVSLDAGADRLDAAIVSRVSNDDSVIMAAPDTALAVKAWKIMRELSLIIGGPLGIEQLLARVLDIIFEEIDAQRGMIILRDEETNELIPEVVRFASRKARAEASKTTIFASRTIINDVLDKVEGVLCSNVETDERFRAGKSVQNLGMRSVICVPIVAREQAFGVIHLDCPVTQHTYSDAELRLLTAIGHQTGMAIENARLLKSLVERERLAAAGETAAHLSHSIKNILQGMRAGSDLVARALDKSDIEQVRRGWAIVDRNMDRCFALMLNMLAFSKQREPYMEMLQVNRIVDDVIKSTQRQADDAGIVVLAELDEHAPPIPVDQEGLHQALLNLVVNALDAVGRNNHGVINVRTKFDVIDRVVTISVTDNGPGIPPAERERIWQPFHSTKGHGGTGLGLAVVRKTIDELGGEVELVDPPDGGAQFVLRLPTADARKRTPGETQAPRRRRS